MKKLFLPFLIIVILAACADDSKPSTCEYQRELDDLEAKLTVFTNDPSTASCNSLRQSAITLLNRLDGCPGVDGVKDALRQWRELDCVQIGE